MRWRWYDTVTVVGWVAVVWAGHLPWWIALPFALALGLARWGAWLMTQGDRE